MPAGRCLELWSGCCERLTVGCPLGLQLGTCLMYRVRQLSVKTESDAHRRKHGSTNEKDCRASRSIITV